MYYKSVVFVKKVSDPADCYYSWLPFTWQWNNKGELIWIL